MCACVNRRSDEERKNRAYVQGKEGATGVLPYDECVCMKREKEKIKCVCLLSVCVCVH